MPAPPPRVLLDENLPRQLKSPLAPAASEVKTVAECGWGGMKNGVLLAAAAAEFDVFVTMDRGIEHQQNVAGLDLCPVLLSAVSNALDDLLPLAPAARAVLATHRPGTLIRVP